MASFVLVHGAWHGGWCWHKLLTQLEKAGHRVAAPDLPGHGTDSTPIETITLASYADRICEVVAQQKEPVVLVGHSMGGLVISQVAERMPDSVQCLVYVAALLPKHDEGFDQIPGSPNIRAAIQVSEDGQSICFDPAHARDSFYADCSDEDVRFATERLCLQPAGIRVDSVSLSADRFGRVPRDYVECVHDRAIELAAQRMLQERQPCRRVYTLDSSHSPFLSMPQELARVLMESAG